ncbi:MAG: PKD domain-containing protein [Cyclobacteriaceae bacterium]|nr:PKD domain-containing protein [Cyclobacteriaceae bacterium]MCH8515136.1 PKD domain-containing protein [Cyclobacteriaceae bacterium]
MKKLNVYMMLFAMLFFFGACSDDDDNGATNPPTEEDAGFTFSVSDQSPNILIFTANNENLLHRWDFGNGSSAEGAEVEGRFPSAGTYTVTLTVNNALGSASSSQEVVIAEDDFTLLDEELVNFLTGGPSATEGKTWVIDSLNAGHFGVGPADGDSPEFFAAGSLEKPNTGLYNSEYTFTLDGLRFNQNTNGTVYIHNSYAEEFAGSFENLFDFSAPFEADQSVNWSLLIEDGENPKITFNNSKSWIGLFVGDDREYEILEIEENRMVIRTIQENNEDLAWYHTLIPAGFDSGGAEPEPATLATLPLNFDDQTPTLTSFEGNAAEIIDNPDKSGLNTSNRVLQITKGGGAFFAGTFFDLENPITLSETEVTLSILIWTPKEVTFRVVLEGGVGAVPVDSEITATEEWTEVTFTYSTEEAGERTRLTIIPDFDEDDFEPGVEYFVDQIRVVD